MTHRTQWFGRLSDAPRGVVERLEANVSYLVLCGRGLDATRTLLLSSNDNGTCVLAQMFAWDERSPVAWLLTTIGLSAHAQPARERRRAFQRFELTMAVWPAKSDPFPDKLGAVLSMPDGLAWDWEQVEPPPLMRWLQSTADLLLEQLRGNAHFAIADTLTTGPGGQAWTRSALDHSVLMPATIHMLLTGHAPFKVTPTA